MSTILTCISQRPALTTSSSFTQRALSSTFYAAVWSSRRVSQLSRSSRVSRPVRFIAVHHAVEKPDSKCLFYMTLIGYTTNTRRQDSTKRRANPFDRLGTLSSLLEDALGAVMTCGKTTTSALSVKSSLVPAAKEMALTMHDANKAACLHEV
jgi:hypothetical protein